ncbi:MAG: hypothetical protein U0795_24750 [Pirellulales bacterium]
MNADTAQQSLERLLAEGSLTLDNLSVPQGFAVAFAFYRNHRAEDCPADADGDMLLYQWGMSRGEDGEFFEVDLTRQFILGGDSEDENIWQLSLTFKFAPTETLRTIESGNKWCPRPRARALDYFEGYVRESAAYQTVSELKPVRVELDYFNAG